MSLFSQDTLRPRSTLQTVQPSDSKQQQTSERQRSSSFSENFAQRVLGLTSTESSTGGGTGSGGGGLSANSSFRRRSSGGAANAGRSIPSSIGLGRRDSQQNRTSFLRSPVLASNSNNSGSGIGASTSSSSNNNLGIVPTLKTLGSYDARNVAAALDQGMDQGRMIDDVWQSVCVRVLPLFNGEGIRGFVEDLNELVLTHVQRTFQRASTTTRHRYHSTKNPSLDLSSLVTGLLIADLTDLVRIGCSTLSTKLSPPSPPSTTNNNNSTKDNNITPSSRTTTTTISDQKLVERLNEIWLFFYTGILPQLEAVFWVLRCDDRLRACVGGTGLERNQERGRGRGEGRIDVRRIALIEFRDGILHPEMERIVKIFEKMYENLRVEGGGEEEVNNSKKEQNTTNNSTEPPIVSHQDIRRSRSSPRPSTATRNVESTSILPPLAPTRNNAFLSPPLPSNPSTNVLQPPPLPVPTTKPTNHLPSTPLRQFSSPARLPSPDPSPNNSPTSTRRNTMINSNSNNSNSDSNSNVKGGGSSFGLQQQSKQSLQRRLQMFLILKSLKTLDDRQDEIDKLCQIILSNTLSSARRRNRSKIRKKKQQTKFDSGGRYSRDEELEENGSYREREDDDDDSTTYDEKSQRGQDQPASSQGGGGGVGVESPQILFDEPSDLSAEEEGEEEDSTHDRHQTSRTRTRKRRSTVGYELPYSTTSSAAVSRSNSRSSRHGNQTGVGTSGYASPILSTSPTEAALDLSGLGYALSRVREEGSNHVGVTIEGGGSESSDGITPTASAPGSIMAGHSGGVGGGGNNLEVKKIRRRSLFLPTSKLIRRSSGNSTVSQGGDIGDSGLNVPEVIEGGGGGGGGEKLRRNLLRRNSSRNSAVLSQQSQHEMSTVLGGRGLSLEDD